MRHIIAVLIFATAITARAQTYDLIDGTNIVKTSYTLPSLGDGISRARFTAAHAAAGWCIRKTEEPKAGEVAEAWELAVVEGQSVYRPTSTATPEVIAQREQTAKLAAITPELWQLASVYRDTLRAYFGPGAETNQAVTYAAVTAYFLKAEATPDNLKAMILLKEAFAAIAAWTGDGTTWSFPWAMLPEVEQ